MSWESLRPGVYRGTVQSTVSIQKSGAITWNQSAHEALGQPELVDILFDEERKLLGLRPTSKAEGSFRVRRLGPQNTWITSARGALRRVGLLPTSAFRQVARLEGGILYISVADLLGRSGQHASSEHDGNGAHARREVKVERGPAH